MSIVRLISDIHLGHESIAIKRGFKNAKEQDDYLVSQWNKVVHKKDTTYVLGDISMESHKFYHILSKLNGKKTFILGNHDFPQHVAKLAKYGRIAGMMKKKFHKQRVTTFLTHCPIHPRELDFRVGLNIHGHLHEEIIMKKYLFGLIKVPDKRYICVSCEQLDFTPKTIDELLNR